MLQHEYMKKVASYLMENEYTFREVFLTAFEKGSTLKGKNLLPLGAKFFPFRVDHFCLFEFFFSNMSTFLGHFVS